MPAVLGFLIAGMVLGPNAANLLTQDILDAPAYNRLISVMECGMGLMLGTEMVWKKMRAYGKQVLIITLTESLGTFAVVSAAFCAIFYFMGIPMFLGLIFGGHRSGHRSSARVVYRDRISYRGTGDPHADPPGGSG